MRLSIRTARWRAHVAQVAASTPGLVPVVKGNGYGFGREWLAGVAAEFADTIAVGTIHELEGLPAVGHPRRAHADPRAAEPVRPAGPNRC